MVMDLVKGLATSHRCQSQYRYCYHRRRYLVMAVGQLEGWAVEAAKAVGQPAVQVAVAVAVAVAAWVLAVDRDWGWALGSSLCP